MSACAAPSYFDDRGSRIERRITEAVPATGNDADPRRLPMYGGVGERLDWRSLQDALLWADVILVGEEHDDGVGHAVERAIAEEVVAMRPRAVVSLEMLERDDQPLVDDYFDGIIDTPAFIKLTDSASWATGGGTWEGWYQPLIDAAKQGGGRVLAANAPRRYVRLGRTGGYERLRAVRGERGRLFDVPTSPVDDAYKQRFLDVMKQADSPSPTTAPATQASTRPASAPAAPPRGHGGDMGEAAFRSQLVWDTTMAASIARARQRGAPKVVHFVGQFHVDFQGGTYQQLRKRLPQARILTISMQRADGRSLRDEDRGRADIVVYTGERPEEPDAAATTAPAVTQPQTQPQ